MKTARTFLLIGMTGGAGALAQTVAPCTPGVMGFVQSNVALGAALRPGTKVALPYTATVRTSFEQRLIDGNVISTEFKTHQAQNAEGWQRREMSFGCTFDAEGKPHIDLSVFVNKLKPVETITWQESTFQPIKEATVSIPEELTAEQKAERLAQAKAHAALHKNSPTASRQPKRDVKSESLGSAIIAGQEVTGTRMTDTIPTGMEGNSMPLVIMTETWTTKEGIIMRWISDDPRRGKTTMEVEEFIPGEPDASLFAPPAGYKIREMKPKLITELAGSTTAP
jgi:hypothetical protein